LDIKAIKTDINHAIMVELCMEKKLLIRHNEYTAKLLIVVTTPQNIYKKISL
jgi:hypothetical protein